MQKIGVIGAGAWGTALAQCMAAEGREVLLWAREPETVAAINESHENTPFLPGLRLHDNITATGSLGQAADADILLLVTPAQYIRATMEALKGDLSEGRPVVICAKGIEIKTGMLMSQVAMDVVPDAQIAVLTGPTFATEIARGLPSAVTLAVKDKDIGAQMVEQIGSRNLRTYLSDDVIGAQIGGAVKNVMAIACGAVTGKGLGESARAALITRGLAEMGRLASAMGAKRETLMGMCGIGDLMLTCNSMQSRNFSFGVEIGKGRKTSDILEGQRSVTEGVYTANAVKTIAQKNAVDMPISTAVCDCVHNDLSMEEAIDAMLDRPVDMELAP